MSTIAATTLAVLVAAAPVTAKPAVPHAKPAAPAAVQSVLPVTATGSVKDAQTGAPIVGALVQQEGSVTSAFTTQDGSFRLLLDKSGQNTITVSSVGYEARTIAIGNGKNLHVSLSPIAGFVPAEPLQPLLPAGTSAAETVPLNSNIAFSYRLRRESLTASGVAGGTADVSGFANNDYRLGLRFRWHRALLEAEGAHNQFPVDVAGLGTDVNPAFSPSTWQVGARVGYVMPFSRSLEGALALGYQWKSLVPNNKDVRYTSSGIDFEQTHHAAGLVGTLAWRPAQGPWHLEGSLGLYPLVLAWAKDTNQVLGKSFLTDARAEVGYEIVPGMRLGVGYQLEDWRGGVGTDSSHLFSVNVHYTPGGLPKEAEQ